MSVAVPLFSRDRLAQWRLEREQYVTISSRSFPERGTFVVNPSARRIMDLCDGKRPLDVIYEEFRASFQNPPSPEQAGEDVNDVLRSLDKLGLIEWVTGVNPFSSDRLADSWTAPSGITYQVCGERDLEAINAFLPLFGISNDAGGEPLPVHYFPVTSSRNEYIDVAIRNKVFESFETYFLGWRGERPVVLLSVISSHPRSRLHCGSVGVVLILPEVVDGMAVAREIADFACERLNRYSAGDNTKIRMVFPKDSPNRKGLLELAFAMGFEHKATLRDEMGYGMDAELWDRWLPRQDR